MVMIENNQVQIELRRTNLRVDEQWSGDRRLVV